MTHQEIADALAQAGADLELAMKDANATCRLRVRQLQRECDVVGHIYRRADPMGSHCVVCNAEE